MLSHLLWQRHVARQTPTTAVLRCPNFYHKCRLHDPNSFFGKQAGALNLHPPPMSSFAKSSPHKYLLSVSHANRQGRGDDYTAVDGRRDATVEMTKFYWSLTKAEVENKGNEERTFHLVCRFPWFSDDEFDPRTTKNSPLCRFHTLSVCFNLSTRGSSIY